MQCAPQCHRPLRHSDAFPASPQNDVLFTARGHPQNYANLNHKQNRAVQAMLFGMAERGMGAAVMGDKGKLRNASSGDG